MKFCFSFSLIFTLNELQQEAAKNEKKAQKNENYFNQPTNVFEMFSRNVKSAL